MRYREILREMSRAEAMAIWRKHGADPNSSDLKTARNDLIKHLHPDKGGDLEDAKLINAAYDVLKKPEASSEDHYHQQWDSDEGPRQRKNWHYTPGENERRDREKEQDTDTRWAWAGHSGGMRSSTNIYRQDYTDVNFIKKRMWELSGKSTEEWTIWGFDGSFTRGVTTVYGSPKIFAQMAEAMIMWQTKGGNPYACRAVVVEKSEPYRSKPFHDDDEDDSEKTLLLIWADGVFYDKKPIPVHYHAFNHNPGNDRSFETRLRRLIDELQEHGGRQHEQPSMHTPGSSGEQTAFETGSYVVHAKHGVGRVINPEVRKGMVRATFKDKHGKIVTGNVKATSLHKASEKDIWYFKHG